MKLPSIKGKKKATTKKEATKKEAPKKKGPKLGHFSIRKSGDGQFYFLLVAGNGEVIMQSEMYTQKIGAKRGIEAIKYHASKAPVRDNCPDGRSS